MHPRASELINVLGLSPHPEGGFYKEVYRSTQKIMSPVHAGQRNSLTDIYFLLSAGQVSRFHRVIHDEIWNFYEGDSLELIELKSDTLEAVKIKLGGTGEVTYKHCVKGGNWQAALTTGGYSLAGCTVAPGFEFEDFTLLKDNQEQCKKFQKKYPGLSNLI